MLNHISVGVSDLEKASSFYDVVLGILGYICLFEEPGQAIAYGETWPEFWINKVSKYKRIACKENGNHVSISSPSIEATNAFHRTALKLGARDAGAPGYRPDYGIGYYSAYIYDLDGNKIEATYYEI